MSKTLYASTAREWLSRATEIADRTNAVMFIPGLPLDVWQEVQKCNSAAHQLIGGMKYQFINDIQAQTIPPAEPVEPVERIAEAAL